MTPVPDKGRLLLLALLVVVLDQWSKWLVEVKLAVSGGLTVIPGLLDLIYVTNTGVAFGLFQTGGRGTGTILLTLLGLTALGIVILYYWRTPETHRLLLVSLSLVLGGAVGNLLDRVARGAVTDFIDVYVGTYHWPTFNVADSAISVGIVLMALETLRARQETPAAEEAIEG